MAFQLFVGSWIACLLFLTLRRKEPDMDVIQLEGAIENDWSLQRRLRSMVLVRLPRDYTAGAADDDGPLVNHSAFEHLSGRTGIAIIDLKDPGTPYYGKVVTVLPFSRGKYYR